MKIVVGGIRADLGKASVPKHYRAHVSNTINLLGSFFNCEKLPLVAETNNGIPSQILDRWLVYAEICPLVMNIIKQTHKTDASHHLKVMADTGQGFLKVAVSILSEYQKNDFDTHKRSSYTEGGVLAKAEKDSGVNKIILVACCAEVSEHYENFKMTFEKIKLNNLFTRFGHENIHIVGDLKFLSSMYGIQPAGSKFPCVFCRLGSVLHNNSFMLFSFPGWKA